MTGTSAPLSGIAVTEIGGSLAGPLAGWLLAGLGASVTRIAPPGPSHLDEALDAMLNEGKTSHVFDLTEARDRRRATAVIASSDIVLDNNPTGRLAGLGVDATELMRADSQLIWVSMPGFASNDTVFGAVPGWEILLGAATGLFTDISLTRPVLGLPPAFTALPLASIYGGVHAALGALAALVGRDRDGHGDHVEVALASSLSAALGSVLLHLDRQPHRYDIPPLPAVVRAVLPALRAAVARLGSGPQEALAKAASALVPPMMDSYRCSDGTLLYVFAMDHDRMPRILLQSLNLWEAAGSVGLVERDPYRGAATDNLADSAALSLGLRRKLRRLVAGRLATRPAEEWEAVLGEAGVPCAVQRTTGQWRDHPAVRAAGLVDDLDGTLVPTMPIWWTPPHFANPTSRTFPALPDHDLPLRGVTVVDLSSMVAGPLAARTLAEMGADVVKIDAPRPHHGPRMVCWYGIEVNRGKSTVLLDLANPDAAAALRSALAGVDVVIDNFAGNTLNRLGLGPAAASISPPPCWVSISAFAGPQGGPWARRRGYDPVLQAATGIMCRFGSEDRPELHAIASCVDALTGYLAALGAIAALIARRRGRPVDHCHTSLAAAAQLSQLPFIVDAANTATPPSGQHAVGLTALHRLYRARDGYLAVAARPDDRDTVLAALGLAESGGDLSASGAVATRIAVAVRPRARGAVIADLRACGIAAIPVRTLADIRHVATSPPGASTAVGRTRQHPAGTTVTFTAPTYVRFAGRGSLEVGRPSPCSPNGSAPHAPRHCYARAWPPPP
jgi:crotonobetainyl-CoA:carnitine CoA-transferase CaiB-like acyl-CoA transferase